MTYNGYVVAPMCDLMTDSNKWRVRVRLERHTGPSTLTESYYLKETYSDKDDADSRAIEFGQKIIDGKCGGLNPP